VRRAGNTVRITAQLINTVTGFHVWSQTYDRRFTDILKIQTEVATAVAERLKVTLAGDETAKLEEGGTKNPEAYEAYLQGAALLSKWDFGETDLRAALSAFDRAISLDPHFALAHEKRALTLNDISIFVAQPAEIGGVRAEAMQSAERAVALAPGLGETHLTLADVYAYGQLDFVRAAPEFERAFALAPGSARVQRAVAAFAGQQGQFQTALVAARRAVSLDPQNLDAYVTLGQVLVMARDYAEALSVLHTAQLLRPDSLYVRANIANALLASGAADEARLLCESSAMPPNNPIRQECLSLAYHQLGRQSEAEHQFQEFKAGHPDAAVEIAGVYAQWGDTKSALQELAKAERQRDSALQVLRVSWTLDPVRNEPEFKAILAHMRFPP
jgi:tetratricopeptide (TPR) repeat protein